ncbi:BON domain-containing protein [Paraburkholderia sp. CNPSo 3076]|uniref:BON domain-containing protein n=1 Tax=Paraburkholderia sp. CNPSo 3076 TaxID=2940936 RepID=UPI00225C2DF0|nr:BON domain-containing protein [Paraburkholderia sp. CNPSo 3076]MCX5541118.1 BON domain-containing protein [Paraburkholderia sp. CNPSo 3076]
MIRDVRSALWRTPSLDASGIRVRARLGVVTLSGWVPARRQIALADNTARSVRGVRSPTTIEREDDLPCTFDAKGITRPEAVLPAHVGMAAVFRVKPSFAPPPPLANPPVGPVAHGHRHTPIVDKIHDARNSRIPLPIRRRSSVRSVTPSA